MHLNSFEAPQFEKCGCKESKIPKIWNRKSVSDSEFVLSPNIFKTQRSKSSIWRLSRLWVDSSTGFPDLHISGMEMWIKYKRTCCCFSEIFQCHCHLSHPLKLWVSAGKKTSLERSLGAAVMWNLDFKLDKFSTQVTQNDTTDSKLLNIIHTSPQYKYNWQIQIHNS